MFKLRRTDSCGSTDSQAHTHLEDIINLSCDVLLTLVSIIGLFTFHTQISKGDITLHWPLYLGFTIMMINGLVGLFQYVNDHSYCSVHCLFDYLQVILLLPCFASELWIKYQMEPQVACHAIAMVGVLPGILFTAFEFRKQYLTDLVLLVGALVISFLGVTNKDYFAGAAVLVFLWAYYSFKRHEIVCDEPLDLFNGAMMIFGLLVLLSLGVVMPTWQDVVDIFSGKDHEGSSGDSAGDKSSGDSAGDKRSSDNSGNDSRGNGGAKESNESDNKSTEEPSPQAESEKTLVKDEPKEEPAAEEPVAEETADEEE